MAYLCSAVRQFRTGVPLHEKLVLKADVCDLGALCELVYGQVLHWVGLPSNFIILQAALDRDTPEEAQHSRSFTTLRPARCKAKADRQNMPTRVV